MNKNINYIVVGVLVVILLAVLMWPRSNNTQTSPDQTTIASETVSESPSESPSVSPSVSIKPKATATPIKVSSYQDALNKYGSVRFQFDSYCRATPAQMVIKTGTSIMLDNRSDKATSISIGKSNYSLSAYGFRIVTPTSATYPATILIDCSAQQNVATLTIAK